MPPEMPKKVRGYPHLADKIGSQPRYAIFRRFGAINAENLLYLQAELTDLEKKLHEQQKADSESGHDNKSKYSLNWYWLNVSASGDDGDTYQLDLVLKIRETLEKYSTKH